jgi:uncharacterized protein
MRRNFLGRGLGFPLRINNRGNVATSEEERLIEESVRIVIGTSPGERVMRPDFGCRLQELVFHPNNHNTAALAAYYVQEALVKLEPRIRDVEVDASPDPSEENVLKVGIRYRVIATNEIRNLVYPFYLRREEAL